MPASTHCRLVLVMGVLLTLVSVLAVPAPAGPLDETSQVEVRGTGFAQLDQLHVEAHDPIVLHSYFGPDNDLVVGRINDTAGVYSSTGRILVQIGAEITDTDPEHFVGPGLTYHTYAGAGLTAYRILEAKKDFPDSRIPSMIKQLLGGYPLTVKGEAFAAVSGLGEIATASVEVGFSDASGVSHNAIDTVIATAIVPDNKDYHMHSQDFNANDGDIFKFDYRAAGTASVNGPQYLHGEAIAYADPVITFDQAAFDTFAAANGLPDVRLDDYLAVQPSPGLRINLPLLGDADSDGKVDFQDLLTLARNWGKTNAAQADGDFNGDFSVGFDDLVILARNYGQTLTAGQLAQLAPSFRTEVDQAFADVPEPAGLGILLLAGAFIVSRRSRAQAV